MRGEVIGATRNMKNTDTQDLRVSARTARLTAADDTDDDGPPWRFGGIAVAAGDILHMDDGTRVLMTAEELRKAAKSQAGEPLTVDHPADDQGRPQYPPPTDETVGKVPRAGWISEAEAIGYEATTHDKEIADGVQGGSYDVSVHPQFKLGEKREDVNAYVAEDIQFLDLSVVSKGDSPSNTAEWGPNQALASFTENTDIGSQLTASADGDGLDEEQQGLISNTVSATLRAFGLSPSEERIDELDLTAEEGGGDGSAETTGAESPSDADNTMQDETREQYVQFLTANAGFEEESVESMDDDVLEQTYELAAEGAADGGSNDGGAGDGPDDDDDKTLAEMTPDEAASKLGDSLREQGFITEDNADEVLAHAEEKRTKAEMADEIIAQSDEYDEGDREDLVASAEPLLKQEHDRVTGQSGVSLQSGTGALTAGAPGMDGGDSDEDLDEYGTGMAEQ